MITLRMNGKNHDLDVSPYMPLLWAMREAAGKRYYSLPIRNA